MGLLTRLCSLLWVNVPLWTYILCLKRSTTRCTCDVEPLNTNHESHSHTRIYKIASLLLLPSPFIILMFVYIKFNGKWVYLYRAIDKEGHSVDFLLRTKRNKAAIDSLNKGLADVDQIDIWKNAYLNSLIEQDHRFIKKQARPTLGFKNFHSAKATIIGIENIRIIQKGQIVGYNPSLLTFLYYAILMAQCV